MTLPPMALETPDTIQLELDAPRRFIEAVKALPSGTRFTADDLAEVTKAMPTPQSVGNLYQMEEFRSLARDTGMGTKSARTKAWVTIWERTANTESNHA